LKMRVHDEEGKKRTSLEKFMKESGSFIETNLFGGIWEHRPISMDFSNLREVVLQVRFQVGEGSCMRYFSVPLTTIHTIFSTSFWTTKTDDSLSVRFKQMFVRDMYDITNRIEQEKKKETES